MADWLNAQSTLPVRVAREGDRPEPGCVLLAATNDHLHFSGGGNRLGYTKEPEATPYRPSIDVFFHSVVARWSGNAVGVLLTGMGRDGAAGLAAMRAKGYHTIAQDEATCAVYGMPKAAAALNAAVAILPLPNIANAVRKAFASSRKRGASSSNSQNCIDIRISSHGTSKCRSAGGARTTRAGRSGSRAGKPGSPPRCCDRGALAADLLADALNAPSAAESAVMVLLVDDQTIVAEAVRRALVDQPRLDFHYCANPEDALRVAQATRPTVILQDLVMPGVDGLTLVRQYRENEATRDIPIIVLSTKEEPRIKSAAFAAGANDYLVKLPDTHRIDRADSLSLALVSESAAA